MDGNNEPMRFKVLSSLFWKFGERITGRLVTFVISLLLARLLAPDDYGVIALIMVFISLAETVVTSGFGNSLVQQKEVDDLDFSSVFYFSMVLSVLLYLIIFVSAPSIARFYNNELLTPLLRVMGIRLISSGVSTVQNAYVDRNMMFKRYFYSTIAGTVISGAAAFWMAYNGYGVWAIAAQYLIQAFVGMLVLWFTVRWRPRLMFSLGRMKSLYNYGWKLLASSLIINAYEHLREMVIGRLYSPADLGYYSKGKSFPSLINDNLTSTINSVLFPAIAKEQSNPQKVKDMTRRSIKTTAYLVTPLMTGLAVAANPLVIFLLTDKWTDCIPYLQIACYSSALAPIQSANLQAIKALGRSDIILKLDIVKRALGIIILVLVMRYGVLAIAMSTIATSTLFLILNISQNAKLLNYNFLEQMMDILPFVGMSALMAAAVYPIQFLNIPLLAVLGFQGIIGAAVYLALSRLFKIDSLGYIIGTLAPMLKRTPK